MKSRRRWAFALGGLVAALLLLWLWAGVSFQSASAGAGGISMDLRSRIQARYGPDSARAGIARILFSIGEEALRLAGLSDSEAAARWRAYEDSLNTPVATATARDFLGAAPFTATATQTQTQTALPTFTLTVTATSTRVPTRVPTRTPTRTAAPTNTPSGASDTVKPTILGVSFSPPPGPLGACVFDVIDMHVFDPAYSSGISGPVYARVTYPDSYQGYFTLSFSSGGFVAGPGSDWDAHYDGSVNYKDPSHPVVTGDTISVELKVQDDAGTGWVLTSPVSYDVSVDCP